MASSSSSSSIGSSSPIFACIHCERSSSEPLIDGWKSRFGEYVQLCRRCHSVYEARQFCETFHAKEDGWRECNSCGKLLHCGCIVSLSDYSLDDFGGIICEACTSAKHGATARSNPRDLEMQPSLLPQSVGIPVFEKVMTTSDANKRCIVIRKQHAMAYLPEVREGQVVPMHVLDTDGKDWNLFYRTWVSKPNTMYVLYGISEFMESTNLKAGDIVAFHMRNDGMLILEVKKTNAGSSSRSSGLNSMRVVAKRSR